jgi:hypothetical protein
MEEGRDKMLKVLEANELPLETKRERIEFELKADPSRSDREIARICGVDHKTVAARRAEIPQNDALGNSPPLQNSPENSPPNQEEASQSVTRDNASSAETVLLPAQGKITIGWNEDGDMILRQSDWPNEDAVIIIAYDYLEMFIDRLTDAIGIPSTKGLMR